MKKLLFSLIFGSLLFFACGSGQQSSASFVVSPQEALVGSQITLDASASDGPITSFEWNFGDGTYGSGQVVNHIYVTAKLFTVTLTIRDSDGGTKTSSSTVDIYREGKKMTLTPLRTSPLGAPELWIDSVYSQDPKTNTAWIAISEFGFDPPYITENHIFTLTLPGDLVQFNGNYQLTGKVASYYQAELIANQNSQIIFRIFYCVGQSNAQFLLIELKMNNLGTGTMDMKAQKGVSCYSGSVKFAVESFPANITITSVKYYD